ncbi:MAG: response regulator [Arenimonas sp.]
MNNGILPRILLIEDNAISREFLYEALLSLEITIDVAETLAGAMRLARMHSHRLLLCDVHLPDGEPDEIFQSLRQLQSTATAIAITAEPSPDVAKHLLAIGYREVWSKPIAMAVLQNNVSRLLRLHKTTVGREILISTELWDEAAALRAVGNNQKTLSALRNLFLTDLPQQMKTIEQAFIQNDVTKLKAECHKLLAACGFVGAASLSYAVKQLSEKPDVIENADEVMLQAKRCLANH